MTKPSDVPQQQIHAPGALTNKKRKAENRLVAAKKRSPFPRSPRHGKHTFVQGDPNTKDHQR